MAQPNGILEDLFNTNRLLPAVTVPDSGSALRIAESLLEGGVKVMEVAFRSPATADAIGSIRQNFPEMHIGAGTILTPEQAGVAIDAGALFGLSPGYNPSVIDEVKNREFPFVPGVSTPSEIEIALQEGFRLLKLFPVDQLGGPGYISAMTGPYRQTGARFIPMGGVGLPNLAEYSRMEMVAALGGSWLVPSRVIREGNFERIRELAEESLRLIEG